MENATSSSWVLFWARSVSFSTDSEARRARWRKSTEIARKIDRADDEPMMAMGAEVLSISVEGVIFTNISSSFPAVDLAGAGFDVFFSHKTKFVSMVQLGHRVSGHRPPKGYKRSKVYFYRPRAEGLSQWVQRFSHERTDELLETIFWLRFGNYRAISCISQGGSNYTVWSEWVWKE